MSEIKNGLLVGLGILLSCCTLSSLNTPLLPAPAAESRAWPNELLTGQVQVETLKTSETIPSPRWLAIDSKDTLYVTVGNNKDSILYAVELETGQVKKYKSSAKNQEVVKEFVRSSPQTYPPGYIIPHVMPTPPLFVEGIEIWQKSPVVTVDGQDQVYVLLPYNLEPFFQTGPYIQINRITFAAITDFWNSGYQKVFSKDDYIKKVNQVFVDNRIFPLNAGKSLYISSSGEMYFSDYRYIYRLKNGQISILKISIPSFLYFSSNDDSQHMEGIVSITEDILGNLFIIQQFPSSTRIWPAIIYQMVPSGQVKILNGSAWLGEDPTPEQALALGFDLELPAEEKFNAPTGIVTDKEGRVYVADSGNHRIRKIWPDENRLETLAGSHEAGFVDAEEGQEARFSNPIGMAWDSQGNLYIADSDNDAIRVIRPKPHNVSQGEK